MRTNRLTRLRHWPGAVYTEHLTELWRREHPAEPTPLVALHEAVAGPSADPPPRIAAVCHIFYPELLDELRAVLQHLPVGSDVFASVSSEADRRSVEEHLAGLPIGRLEIRIAPNRGRDIAPKYVTFADVIDGDHDLLLFLHTKKTTRESVGPGWRAHLYDTLAGSTAGVQAVVEVFRKDPALGVLAPQHYGDISANTGWHGSYAHAAALGRRTGIAVRRWAPPDFASGSMFWARPQALRPVSRLRLSIEDFPREAGQNAYTLMHALERFVFLSAEHAGYRSALIGTSTTQVGRAAPVGSVEAGGPRTWMRFAALGPTLAELVRETAKRRSKLRPARVRAWLRRTGRPGALR